MPGFFALGLLLIPVGVLLARRRDVKKGVEPVPSKEFVLPRIDFNDPRTVRLALTIAFLSAVNFAVLGTTSYCGVVYMDSVEFCGKVCHSVMEPEFAAYQNSPHSRVECAECHIGAGAPWFVKAKLSGVWQVLAVTFNTYERPIAAPVANLRPSRDTCEHCHQPNKFTGERVRVITHYSEDETNTPNYTVLLKHIGGGGSAHGIHSWHIDPRRQTTYTALDPQRQEIASVRVAEPDGTTTEFFMNGKEPPAEDAAKGEVRTMDCIDCHNRPTHIFELPKDAVDKAMNLGRIDATLQFIRKVAVEALTESVGEKGDLDKIARRLESHHPGQFFAAPCLTPFLVAFPISGDVAGIAHRQKMEIGCLPQNFNDLECGGFLAFDPVRINRVDDGDGMAIRNFAHQSQRDIEIAAHRNHLGAAHERLGQFAQGDFPPGQKHGAGDADAGGISRGRGRGVAGGSANDGLGPLFNRARNRHGHSPVLEGSRRIQPFVFEIDLCGRSNFLAQARRKNERGVAFVERNDRGLVGDRQKRSISRNDAIPTHNSLFFIIIPLPVSWEGIKF